MSHSSSPDPTTGALLPELSTTNPEAAVEPGISLKEDDATHGAGGPSDEEAPAQQPGSHAKPGFVFLGVIALITLVADLATKLWAEKTLQTVQGFPLPKVLLKAKVGFGFLLARNKGGAWGLLQSSDEHIRKPFFVIVSLLAIGFIVTLYRRLHPTQKALRWGLPLVLGGALGNLVDRIRYGFVIDFIDFNMVWGGATHHWPTFNVADIAICIGVGLMALDMLAVRRGVIPFSASAAGGAQQAAPTEVLAAEQSAAAEGETR